MSGPRKITKITSGGQSGVDRAALDVAIARGIAYGGWCPAGGWAEDYPDAPGLLAAYPALLATTSADPAERTRRNVRDSDATLVIRDPDVASPGTDLTVNVAEDLRKPVLAVVGGDADAARVRAWLATLADDLTLNVAGPRESEWPGAYARTRDCLTTILWVGAG